MGYALRFYKRINIIIDFLLEMPRVRRTKVIISVMSILGIILGAVFIIPGWFHKDKSNEYWAYISPELVGMDSQILDNMIYDVEINSYNVYSILVIRNGFIVNEWYARFFHKDYLFRLFSVSKSITSTLIGIAVDKGFISNLNKSVLDFFTDKDIANIDSQKEAITIEHLLTMTTGLDWPEYYPYDDPRNPYFDWLASEDHVEYVLNRTIIAIPGQEFNYNTGATHLLAAILERATNMSTLDFAIKYLFSPLHIYDYYLLHDPQGVGCGGDGFFLRARDMAKIGYLFLKNGKWEENQIVSEYWVNVSTSSKVNLGSYGYGFQWWIFQNDSCYQALGYGGQVISVHYTLNLLVVFTGMEHNFDYSSYLINSYILPSLM